MTELLRTIAVLLAVVGLPAAWRLGVPLGRWRAERQRDLMVCYWLRINS